VSSISGRFCLAAETDGRRWQLTTVAPNLQDIQIVTFDVGAAGR
jgi:hypothetical protein